MSLLLDALKKAAEKKAKKTAEGSDAVDETQVDSTELEADATEQLNAQADSTEFDETLQQTEVEATELDYSEDQTRLDETLSEETEQLSGAAHSLDDDTEIQTQAEFEEVGIEGETEFDQTEQQIQYDSIEGDTAEIPELADEDSTLFIADDADENVIIKASDSSTEEVTHSELTDTYSMTEEMGEEMELTDDDVTEFMGDGLRDDTQTLTPLGSTAATQEDTTVTNPDSLSLTDLAYEEDLSLNALEDTHQAEPQAAEKAQDSISQEQPSSGKDDTVTSGFSLDEIPEPERTTQMVDQSTSSSVDIDQLTNDQTVTVKSTTATRTLAPDNYDRTLLRFSDSDTSNIFPGLKSDSNTVMTPDYAKKVFIRKSQGIKTGNLKLFSGLGLLILVLVMVWGLFGLQEESETIDNGLVRLKRDPMPGVIKPKTDKESVRLFEKENEQADGKVIEMIATADQIIESDAETVEVSDASSLGTIVSSDKPDENVQTGGDQDDQTGIAKQAVKDAELPADQSEKRPANNELAMADVGLSQSSNSNEGQSSPGEKSTDITITTSSRISEKDNLLSSAYSSYESGDIAKAKSQYDQVIALDGDNRDALLGRAAIHVIDQEFEEAITLYQKLLLSNPKDSLAMTSLISVANIDPRAGESQLKGLLREQPESPYLYFALGNMYGIQERWVEAQSAYFRALELKPEDPNYAYNLAVSLEHINKPDSAIIFYQQALENQTNALASFDTQLVTQRVEVLSQ